MIDASLPPAPSSPGPKSLTFKKSFFNDDDDDDNSNVPPSPGMAPDNWGKQSFDFSRSPRLLSAPRDSGKPRTRSPSPLGRASISVLQEEEEEEEEGKVVSKTAADSSNLRPLIKLQLASQPIVDASSQSPLSHRRRSSRSRRLSVGVNAATQFSANFDPSSNNNNESLPAWYGASGARFRYKKFPWGHNQENLQEYFQAAFQYIDEARRQGWGVLVHCQCGVSRSASMMLAYVMRTLRMPLHEAYAYVKERSSAIIPNMSLLYQFV